MKSVDLGLAQSKSRRCYLQAHHRRAGKKRLLQRQTGGGQPRTFRRREGQGRPNRAKFTSRSPSPDARLLLRPRAAGTACRHWGKGAAEVGPRRGRKGTATLRPGEPPPHLPQPDGAGRGGGRAGAGGGWGPRPRHPLRPVNDIPAAGAPTRPGGSPAAHAPQAGRDRLVRLPARRREQQGRLTCPRAGPAPPLPGGDPAPGLGSAALGPAAARAPRPPPHRLLRVRAASAWGCGGC